MSDSRLEISVFLADDHAVVRDGLRLILETQGSFSVIGEAADGHEAIRQICRLCPDVAIIDIAMPKLDGIEVTRRISQSCPNTRVIILSMYATSEHIYRALQAGAQGYLLKESAGREVVEAVQAVHAGQRYLSRRIADAVVEEYIRLRQSGPVESPLERLTWREKEILQLVVEGKSSAEIAEILSLSPKTVETYRSRLMQKLNIHDIPGLVKFAIRQGLISLDD